MKQFAGLLVSAMFCYPLYAGSELSLVGSWKADGRKTVASMIEGGKLDKSVDIRGLASVVADATYIFTENTIDIAFESDPGYRDNPVPYRVSATSGSSITVIYPATYGQNSEETYYFTADGQCIYIKRDQYNDYFCR